MFLLRKNLAAASEVIDASSDFHYLSKESCYLDSACQTLRPQQVITAETEYYEQYNACGGRVKYAWGAKVDEKVRTTRKLLLAQAGKSEKDYCVAFTLNTTYGINLVLHQLAQNEFSRIVTSDIEHNSVFLPSMSFAKKRSVDRLVLPRLKDGSVQYTAADLSRSIVLMNSMSNIDGRTAGNVEQLTTDAHTHGGIVLIDAAQGFAHDSERLKDTDFDAAFGSGHKMYGPSIGFIIMKRSLLARLDPFFLGGGTVTDVKKDTYSLVGEGEEAHAILEPGLQNWGGIIGLGSAVTWLNSQHEAMLHEKKIATFLYEGLKQHARIHLFNTQPSPIQSFYVEGIDSHKISLYLSEQNIMCRSGHFCCHNYLDHQLQLPPLVRVSLGLHNTQTHVEKFLGALTKILSAL